MRRSIIILFTLTCLIGIPTKSNGQNYPTIPSIPSPTAANLGVYGEIPVSHYTGTPNISIPLYELKAGGIMVPVTLSYHPAGIRPLLHPGPTGLGWTLQIGGAITRTIKGDLPDEYKSLWTGGDYSEQKVGYYHHTSILNSGLWPFYFSTQSCENLAFFHESRFKDTEPDEFNFSFLGISGAFYFDHTGNIKVQSDRPLKVIFDDNDVIDPYALGFKWSAAHSKTFLKFTIIDEFGNKYIFGDDAIEFSSKIADFRAGSNSLEVSASLCANSWFLKEIIPSDGSAKIEFEYERGPIISQLFDYYYRISISYFYGKSACRACAPSGSVFSKMGSFIYPVYLKSINHQDSKIKLYYSKSNEQKYFFGEYGDFCPEEIRNSFSETNFPFTMIYYYDINYYKTHQYQNDYEKIEWLKLDKIEIISNESILKEVLFSYIESPSSRLFLKNVNMNNDNTNSMRYTFCYKDTNKLTRYAFTGVDAWGFYNGNLDSGRPSHNNVDELFNQSGVLQKIYYPSGGYNEFEFESNIVSEAVDRKNRTLLQPYPAIVGGLRIKSIRTNDRHGNEIVKHYNYTSDYMINRISAKSTGILNVVPIFQIQNDKLIATCYEDSYFAYNEERSNPIIPLTSYNGGDFIGYTTVTEIFKKSNEPEGYKQYTFTNHGNGYNDDSALYSWNNDFFWNIAHSSRRLERGRLLMEVFFNEHKDTILKKEYMWSVKGSKSPNNNVKSLQGGCFLNLPVLRHFSSNAYLNYVYKFKMVQEKETSYDVTTNRRIVTTTDYIYDSFGLLTEQKVTNSDNSTYHTQYKYPLDFPFTAPYNTMITKNIIGPVVEKSKYKNINTLLSKEVNNYSPWHNSFYAPANVQQQSGTGELETRAAYTYDTKGNIRQVTKDNVEHSVYLWGYQHQYPIAKVEGASYAQIESVLGESLINSLAESNNPDVADLDNRLRNGLQNQAVLISTFTYMPLIGISTQRDPNRLLTMYEYDSFGRLKTVKDHLGNVLQQYEYKYGAE